MFLQVGNFNAARCVPTGWEWMIIKIGCIVQNTAYFLKIKIYFFLLVFFLAFA